MTVSVRVSGARVFARSAAWRCAVGMLGAWGLACGGAPSEPAELGIVSAEELEHRLEDGTAPFILDVRSQKEFDAGHLPGAVRISHDTLDERLDALPAARDAEIVVHCESGRRARAAEAWLREQGYTNVRDLEGHMGMWRAEGRATESAASP